MFSRQDEKMQPESFFGVMRPRLKKQNAVNYVDMSALDKDLMVLKEGVRQQSPAERGITLGTALDYWTI